MQLIDYWSLLGAPGSTWDDVDLQIVGWYHRWRPECHDTGFQELNGIGTTVLSVNTTFGWFFWGLLLYSYTDIIFFEHTSTTLATISDLATMLFFIRAGCLSMFVTSNCKGTLSENNHGSWHWTQTHFPGVHFVRNDETGSAIRTLLDGKINPKDWQVLSLGDVGFLLFF